MTEMDEQPDEAPEEPPEEPEKPKLITVQGDATEPQGDGMKFLVHCCNDVGAWGAGFVLALSRRWPLTKHEYESWYVQTDLSTTSGKFRLGEVQFLPVEDDIVVCNMIGQRGVAPSNGKPPIRYGAIEAGLAKIREKIEAIRESAGDIAISVHCPKFGAGLAGGDWDRIEPLLKAGFVENGINVTVYEFAG